jgi:hypothetical protein
MKTSADDDQFWQAALYALGECSPEERALFEEQLCHDEDLCLSLAEAGQLIGLVQTAQHSTEHVTLSQTPAIPSPGNRPSQFRPLAAICSTIAIVMLTLGVAGLSSTSVISEAELVSQIMNSESAAEEADLEIPDYEWQELETPNWLLTAIELEDTTESVPEDSLDDSSI